MSPIYYLSLLEEARYDTVSVFLWLRIAAGVCYGSLKKAKEKERKEKERKEKEKEKRKFFVCLFVVFVAGVDDATDATDESGPIAVAGVTIRC